MPDFTRSEAGSDRTDFSHLLVAEPQYRLIEEHEILEARRKIAEAMMTARGMVWPSAPPTSPPPAPPSPQAVQSYADRGQSSSGKRRQAELSSLSERIHRLQNMRDSGVHFESVQSTPSSVTQPSTPSTLFSRENPKHGECLSSDGEKARGLRKVEAYSNLNQPFIGFAAKRCAQVRRLNDQPPPLLLPGIDRINGATPPAASSPPKKSSAFDLVSHPSIVSPPTGSPTKTDRQRMHRPSRYRRAPSPGHVLPQPRATTPAIEEEVEEELTNSSLQPAPLQPAPLKVRSRAPKREGMILSISTSNVVDDSQIAPSPLCSAPSASAVAVATGAALAEQSKWHCPMSPCLLRKSPSTPTTPQQNYCRPLSPDVSPSFQPLPVSTSPPMALRSRRERTRPIPSVPTLQTNLAPDDFESLCSPRAAPAVPRPSSGYAGTTASWSCTTLASATNPRPVTPISPHTRVGPSLADGTCITRPSTASGASSASYPLPCSDNEFVSFWDDDSDIDGEDGEANLWNRVKTRLQKAPKASLPTPPVSATSANFALSRSNSLAKNKSYQKTRTKSSESNSTCGESTMASSVTAASLLPESTATSFSSTTSHAFSIFPQATSSAAMNSAAKQHSVSTLADGEGADHDSSAFERKRKRSLSNLLRGRRLQ